MSVPIEAVQARFGFERYLMLVRFIERIHVRTAYQRALVQGGPYSLLA